jgi:hypothetical protein
VKLFFDIEFFKYFFRVLHEASSSWLKFLHNFQKHPDTGYLTSDNEPGGIENATHNTLECKPEHGGDKYPAFPPDVLWVAFSIPPGSLSLVKCPVYDKSNSTKVTNKFKIKTKIFRLYRLR